MESRLNYRNQKLLEAVRDFPCQHCGAEDGTVVAAHSNRGRHGKGMGIKAHDWAIAALCHRCHMELDQGHLYDRVTKYEMWDQAFCKTLHLLWTSGKLKIHQT
jgi:transcription elongation factor Elf1